MNNDFINTRSKRVKYTFASPPSNNLRDIEPEEEYISFFYQIATFPDPYTKKFNMRKFIMSGNNDFLDIKEYNLTKKQAKKFYAEKKPNKFKRYSVYNLKDVGYPVMTDILTAKSSILSQDYDYTGFAPF